MILRLYEKDKLAQRFFQKAKCLGGGAYKNRIHHIAQLELSPFPLKNLEVKFGKFILDNCKWGKIIEDQQKNPRLEQSESLSER